MQTSQEAREGWGKAQGAPLGGCGWEEGAHRATCNIVAAVRTCHLDLPRRLYKQVGALQVPVHNSLLVPAGRVSDSSRAWWAGMHEGAEPPCMLCNSGALSCRTAAGHVCCGSQHYCQHFKHPDTNSSQVQHAPGCIQSLVEANSTCKNSHKNPSMKQQQLTGTACPLWRPAPCSGGAARSGAAAWRAWSWRLAERPPASRARSTLRQGRCGDR